MQPEGNGIPFRCAKIIYTPNKLHNYVYVGNNPLNSIDPLGLEESSESWFCDCPKSESDLKDDTGWCLDSKYSPTTHPGLNCYRSLEGVSGQQCCYGSNGSLGEDPSPDIISPAIGRNSDGTCEFSMKSWEFWGHVFADFILGTMAENEKYLREVKPELAY